MSKETAWYRGRTPKGLQIGEPYPSTQVNHRIKIFIMHYCYSLKNAVPFNHLARPLHYYELYNYKLSSKTWICSFIKKKRKENNHANGQCDIKIILLDLLKIKFYLARNTSL